MSRETENFYEMVISNIFVLSFALTYSNQLSTIWRARRSDVRPETCGASFQTKRTQNIFMLSLIPTYSILLSTTSQRLAVPLSLQNGKRFACFPSRQHIRINFPPDKLLWQSADNQMIQTIRPEAFAASFQTKRTQNICILSFSEVFASSIYAKK